MPMRTAQTVWQGPLETGTGKVELASSHAGRFDVSFPRRTADSAGGTTSPEELIAAAHCSCYAMQLSALIDAAGGTVRRLEVTADVSLGPDPAGGLRLARVNLTLGGDVEGLDAETYARLAGEARAGCPVSKALAGVQIAIQVQTPTLR